MKNIILIGLMGSGKTTIGSLLSKKLNMPFIDMDEYVEQTNNQTISEMFKISEAYFRNKETEACKELGVLDNHIISTGGGAVMKEENVNYLSDNSIIFFIDRPVEMIVGDVDTNHRPLIKDKANKLYDLSKQRYSTYMKVADKHIINDGSLEDVLKKITDIIKYDQ